MKNIALYFSFSILLSVLFSACEKQDDKDTDTPQGMAISVNYPIANVNDRLSFEIINQVYNITGVRWTMGDGSNAVSGSTWIEHAYNTPGTYTVTALVFHGTTSTELTRQVTIEGTNATQNAIRIKKVELIEFDNSVGDFGYNSNDSRRKPDIYFDINYTDQDYNYLNLYFKSEVKTDNTNSKPTWVLDNSFPLIYYANVRRLHIGFHDDDTAEGSNDEYYGSIDVEDYYIQSVLTTKPTTIQLSEFSPIGPVDLTIVLTVEWL